ncbi:3'-5' exonuclease [uncultured Brevundimonas sp.]|uniref:3'-5' exonuclease n=1 Tax=uncultured Brevundimonas sp. TaxID=213418 RepID=UPI0025FC5915|nr:3'-5' exonuclease [uncultured Brevundimonas sp.]
MRNVMVDTETLGTAPGSVILSLGACVFDPHHPGREIDETFYATISRASCEAVGLTVDPKTLEWWSDPSRAEARAALDVDPQPIGDVLAAFTAWWNRKQAVYFWAHAPNFDETLLSAAYRACGMTPPWRFWDVRCTRTIYDLAKVRPDRAQGTHHNALDDAKAQAAAVTVAYRALGIAA